MKTQRRVRLKEFKDLQAPSSYVILMRPNEVLNRQREIGMKKIIFSFALTLVATANLFAASLTVEKTEGTVEVLKKGAAESAAVTQETVLEPGDRVKVDEKSLLNLKGQKLSLELDEKTDLTVEALSEDGASASLQLQKGKLRITSALDKEDGLEIKTPTSLATTGRSFFRIWVYEFLEESFTRLDVFEGRAKFSDLKSEQPYEVQAGQHVTGGIEGVTAPKGEEKKAEEKASPEARPGPSPESSDKPESADKKDAAIPNSDAKIYEKVLSGEKPEEEPHQ